MEKEKKDIILQYTNELMCSTSNLKGTFDFTAGLIECQPPNETFEIRIENLRAVFHLVVDELDRATKIIEKIDDVLIKKEIPGA